MVLSIITPYIVHIPTQVLVLSLNPKRVYINKLKARNAIPPSRIENITSKTVMAEAFFQPNSLARHMITARQGTRLA